MNLRKILIVISAVILSGCAREVSIYTIPSGSSITINNNVYTTPVNLHIQDGTYRISAELDGYESESFDITVSSENVRFSQYLTPSKVNFELEISPIDSDVFLGSQRLVNGSNLIVPGSYTLRASKPAYRPFEEDVIIDLSTNYSKSIVLDRSKKITVNMDFSDPALKGQKPEDYSSIEFYSGGRSYTLKDISKFRLELGKKHIIQLRESGVVLESYIIPAEENELEIEIRSFNEASYVVEKVLNSEEGIDSDKVFKRLFKPDGIVNSISRQYSSYYNSLVNQYNYDILLYLIGNGSFDTIGNRDLYQPLLKSDDLEMFIQLENAGAEKLSSLMGYIVENRAYRCLEHVLKNMKEEEINKAIKYEAADDFRGGISYMIFLTQEDKKAFDMFIKYGARTDVKEVMKYYDFDNPGTIIKTTVIDSVSGAFQKSEDRKDFK